MILPGRHYFEGTVLKISAAMVASVAPQKKKKKLGIRFHLKHTMNTYEELGKYEVGPYRWSSVALRVEKFG